MAATGGALGVILAPPFLKPNRVRADLDEVAGVYAHLADLVGPEHLMIGTDINGTAWLGNHDDGVSVSGDGNVIGGNGGDPLPALCEDYCNLIRLAQAFNTVHLMGGYPVEPIDLPPERVPTERGDARWDGGDLTRVEGTYGDYVLSKVAKVFPDLEQSVL